MASQSSTPFQGREQVFGSTTYAQCGDDLYFANIFGLLNIEKPNYLDIGAHHPFDGSNTALLYQRGSRGVVVEANPDLIDNFCRERPKDTILNVGVGPRPGTLPFYRIDDWSGRNTFSKTTAEEFVGKHPQFKISDVIQIEVVTLNDIVQKYCEGKFPDLLSIDAEGMDFEILESADFSQTKPKIICAEIVTGADVISTANISQLLKTRGFVPYVRTWGNAIFVNAEVSERLSF